MSKIQNNIELCLVILETDEDAVLIRKPYCEICATRKLKAIRFCQISEKEALELCNLYKGTLRKLNIVCECKRM